MTKKKTQIGWKCPHCGGRYGYYKGDNVNGICDVYCEKKVEAGKWIPLYEEAEACHSWREEFDEKFVEHSPMANWVDTENGEKGKCLDDLLDFTEEVEKQARKDEREKAVEAFIIKRA